MQSAPAPVLPVASSVRPITTAGLQPPSAAQPAVDEGTEDEQRARQQCDDARQLFNTGRYEDAVVRLSEAETHQARRVQITRALWHTQVTTRIKSLGAVIDGLCKTLSQCTDASETEKLRAILMRILELPTSREVTYARRDVVLRVCLKRVRASPLTERLCQLNAQIAELARAAQSVDPQAEAALTTALQAAANRVLAGAPDALAQAFCNAWQLLTARKDVLATWRRQGDDDEMHRLYVELQGQQRALLQQFNLETSSHYETLKSATASVDAEYFYHTRVTQKCQQHLRGMIFVPDWLPADLLKLNVYIATRLVEAASIAPTEHSLDSDVLFDLLLQRFGIEAHLRIFEWILACPQNVGLKREGCRQSQQEGRKQLSAFKTQLRAYFPGSLEPSVNASCAWATLRLKSARETRRYAEGHPDALKTFLGENPSTQPALDVFYISDQIDHAYVHWLSGLIGHDFAEATHATFVFLQQGAIYFEQCKEILEDALSQSATDVSFYTLGLGPLKCVAILATCCQKLYAQDKRPKVAMLYLQTLDLFDAYMMFFCRIENAECDGGLQRILADFGFAARRGVMLSGFAEHTMNLREAVNGPR